MPCRVQDRRNALSPPPIRPRFSVVPRAADTGWAGPAHAVQGTRRGGCGPMACRWLTRAGGRTGRPKSRWRFWHSHDANVCLHFQIGGPDAKSLGLTGRRTTEPARPPGAGDITFSEVAVSQPSASTPPPFSHDLTAKSIFAEPEAARDLVALLAARECPELQGWRPVRLVAGSAVTAEPERHPPQTEGHRDLVWELARDDEADRMLLHLEFQSQRAADMSERMFLYALRMSPDLRGLEVCGGGGQHRR